MAYRHNPIPYDQRCHYCRDRAAEADALCGECRPRFEQHLHVLRDPDAATPEECKATANFTQYDRKCALRLAVARLWPDVKASDDRKITVLRQLGRYCWTVSDIADRATAGYALPSPVVLDYQATLKAKLPRWARWA